MDRQYSIGVDAGGTKVAYGLFNACGEIVDRVEHSTDPDADGPGFSDTLIENLDLIVNKNNLTYDMLDGIGIGMPSFIKRETGYVFMTSAMPKIKDFTMRDYLEKRLPVRIVLDNDANTAALAEFRLGAGRGTEHMVYIVIGTGFGSGIIIDGKVFSGSYGAAGECGHAIATPGKGILCGCENKGCYMSYIAGKHIPERVRLGLAEGIKSTLNPETATGQRLLEAYNNGDLLAIKMIEDMAGYLAECIFNIYQLLNIETFVFGGGITRLGDPLFSRMREIFNGYYHIPFPVHFKMAELGEDIGIIGAAEYLK
ncbi:MAG: ROK family protein [Oscillospiraceae bacterium]|nr:ROK family protein [Oscillospiraceae bacterium]